MVLLLQERLSSVSPAAWAAAMSPSTAAERVESPRGAVLLGAPIGAGAAALAALAALGVAAGELAGWHAARQHARTASRMAVQAGKQAEPTADPLGARASSPLGLIRHRDRGRRDARGPRRV